MSENQQRDIIKEILKHDPRYKEEAYTFVREGLDYTVQNLTDFSGDEHQHVRGWELSEGIREYAIREYGPISFRVLKHWGIHRSEDFGEIVYNMIDKQLLGKTEDDEKEDFESVFDFDDAFRKPFLPENPANGSLN